MSPIGTISTVLDPGSSERGTKSGSGVSLGEYPHDDNGAPGGMLGPTNQPPQHKGGPSAVKPEDEIIALDNSHLAQQVSVI